MSKTTTTKSQEKVSVRVQAIPFDKVEATIGLIKRDAGKLQNKIHAVAVSILQQWTMNKCKCDEAARLLSLLQDASPYHTKAFADWVQKYLPLIWNKETQVWVSDASEKLLKGNAFKDARDNPFWTVSPAQKASPYNFLDVLSKEIEKAEKRACKPKEGDVVSLDQVLKLKALVSSMQVVPTDE